MNIFFYKLTTDDGGAPCIENRMLTLAICKPFIRKASREGDLIFGFAANNLDRENHLIYAARVTEKIPGGVYYKDKVYTDRSDCIYEFKGEAYRWRRNAKYHGPANLTHDLGNRKEGYDRAIVICSDDFRYFGSSASAVYASKYPRIASAVRRLGQGHRVNHAAELTDQFNSYARVIWRQHRRKICGHPTSGPMKGIDHGGESCGVCDGYTARCES
jgi:hypothetical protein